MAEFYEKIWWVIRGLLVLLNNLYCIPTYVVWMIILRPLLYLAPTLYWTLEGILFHWLLTMVAFWSHSAHYRIVETGDSIDGLINDETLVLVNHQSTSDVPLLMAAFASRPSLLPRLNWIMDAVFQYTNFGVVSALHGDFFINAGRNFRDDSIKALETYLSTTWIPKARKWLVLFPEGGFLRKRKENSNRYSRKMGLPELEHVTLPRLGALNAIIDTIGPRIKRASQRDFHVVYNTKPSELKWIVDMTIAYPNGEPLDLVAIVTGCAPPCQVHFHYRLYPIHEVPLERMALQKWLYTRYIIKEDMLEKYYNSGEWVSGPTPPHFPTLDLVPSPNDPDGGGELHHLYRNPYEEEEDGIVEYDTEEEEEEEGEPEVVGYGSTPGPRLVEQDLFRILILHLFFITSTFTHVVLFNKLVVRYGWITPPP